MSEGLWITGPDHQWVAEDHVMALADFLKSVFTDIDRVVDTLRTLERVDVMTLEGFLATVSWDEVARIRVRVDELALNAREIFSALWEYAYATAAQERARIQTFDAPRESLLAAAAFLVTGAKGPRDGSSAGVPDAARALLSQNFVLDTVSVEHHQADGLVQPASTFAERIARIPDDPRFPIRIERYTQPDGSHHVDVYIAGTRDLGFGSSSEPFDMESNVALIAGVTAASLVAVEKAMKVAGVRSGDRVTFVGHSQGGLVAARLAESGRYSTAGLLTVGAPVGSAPVRGNYPAVAFSHSDDVVPGLGGKAGASQVIGVSRPSGKGPGDLGGAHSLDAYQSSAHTLDESPARNRLGHLPVAKGTAQPSYVSAQRD